MAAAEELAEDQVASQAPEEEYISLGVFRK